MPDTYPHPSNGVILRPEVRTRYKLTYRRIDRTSYELIATGINLTSAIAAADQPTSPIDAIFWDVYSQSWQHMTRYALDRAIGNLPNEYREAIDG